MKGRVSVSEDWEKVCDGFFFGIEMGLYGEE